MKDKYAISLVSYWNTKPFLYGLQHSSLATDIDLQLDIPSAGGKKILNNQVDIGLVPVAVLAKLSDARIISNYFIGAEGKVKSVCIYSDVPIEKTERIFLDHHSITSVQLTKILLKEYWQLSPELIEAYPGYIDEIKDETAGLVIGDRTFALNHKFRYRYDLAEAWKNMTGLPFVFAAWITRKDIPQDFILRLDEALQAGIRNIETIANEASSQLFTKEELLDYYRNYISYDLTPEKRKAVDVFIGKVRKMSEEIVR